jgi:predicted TIM-barrel fold metal-dependent hydrolase
LVGFLMPSLDAIQKNPRYTARLSTTFLPEPDPRPVWCPVISVDDHLLEPATLFSRMPAELREQGPQFREDDDGLPFWEVNGKRHHIIISDGAVGRPMTEWNMAPQRISELRAGVYDVDARVSDMDLNGVWASLNFPSGPWGFCGTTLSRIPDPRVSLAAVRAYNGWVLEEWCASYPDRFVPCQIPWLQNPVMAAEDIRANATRGFSAVSFSENPEAIGFSSLYSGDWDPFFAACEETETVINLHIGSSGSVIRPSEDSPTDVSVALFPLNGMISLTDWIFSKAPVRFPGLKIAISEGGVTWVPMMRERLARAFRQVEASHVWTRSDPHPVEVLERNFWFTSIEDPSAFHQLDVIGADRVMAEADYPHKDSSWPDTQALLKNQLQHLDDATVRMVCYGNASGLYRHPAPPESILAKSEIGVARDA